MNALVALLIVAASPSPGMVASVPWLFEEGNLPSEVRKMEEEYHRMLASVVNLYPPQKLAAFLKKKENVLFSMCKEDLVCWSRLRAKLGVQVLIRNELTRLGTQYFLYVQVLRWDGKKLDVAGSFTLPLTKGWLKKIEPMLVRMVAPRLWTGTLVVNSDVKGADVVVDGAPMCKTPCKGLTLSVGVHAVRITHELYRDFVKFVEIKYHQTSTVTANLTAFPKVTGRLRAKKVKRREQIVVEEGEVLPWYQRKWGIAAIMAGAALVSFGIGYALAPDRIVYPPYDVHIGIR